MTTAEVVKIILCILFSYGDGSLPFGYWWGKLIKGPNYDIRDHGSGNIGATNVFRVLGTIGLPVFVLDIGKGYIPALLGSNFVSPAFGGLCLVLAGLGHAFSAYFYWKEGKFSGGKSVATYFGGLLALQPVVALVGLGVFLIAVAVTRYVSLGSMLGVVGALVCGCLMHLAAPWIIILSVMTLLIGIFHRRNIGRLIEGCENKLGEHIEEEGAISAFALHALSIDDFKQSRITSTLERLIRQGVITERQARWLITKGPVLEVGQITGIEFPDGTGGRVLLLVVPLLPDQIKDPKYQSLLNELLRAAAVQSKRRGATVLTLGALLSTVGRGGQDLQDWCDNRGLGLVIDNGAGCTAAATIAMIEKMLRESQYTHKKSLVECILAIIGASGIIGHILVRFFHRRTEETIAVARDERKLGDVETLARITTEIGEIAKADVVICTTSAVETIINPSTVHLVKEGCVIGDVAVPPDVDMAILEARPDISVGRSGQFLLPGRPKVSVDFHFGQKDGVNLAPACLVQGLILAKTKQFQHASRFSTIGEDAINFYRQQIIDLDFELVVTDHCERTIFSGNN